MAAPSLKAGRGPGTREEREGNKKGAWPMAMPLGTPERVRDYSFSVGTEPGLTGLPLRPDQPDARLAAEGLEAEFHQLLRPVAVVLPDPGIQVGVQELHLAEDRREAFQRPPVYWL